MKTDSLQDVIVSTIGHQTLTTDQLLAQLCTDERIREIRLSRARLSQVMRSMVVSGRIVRVTEPYGTTSVTRFSLPTDAYSAESPPDTPGWIVVKYDDGRLNGEILGSNFTEADARTCASTLNARDRDARRVSASRRT